MSTRRRVLLALLLPSLALPAIGLADRGLLVRGDRESERMLAWQMYSLDRSSPEYVAVLDAGQEQPVDIDALAATIERRMHYGSHLPELVCESDPAVVAVRRITPGGTRTWTC